MMLWEVGISRDGLCARVYRPTENESGGDGGSPEEELGASAEKTAPVNSPVPGAVSLCGGADAGCTPESDRLKVEFFVRFGGVWPFQPPDGRLLTFTVKLYCAQSIGTLRHELVQRLHARYPGLIRPSESLSDCRIMYAGKVFGDDETTLYDTRVQRDGQFTFLFERSLWCGASDGSGAGGSNDVL